MNLGVFCGSSAGNQPDFLSAARELGGIMARKGVGVVYGGASVGMMKALADSALAAGGEVIGVIPQSLVTREIAHAGLTELVVVKTLEERKRIMVERSHGFLILPGGFGTLDEAFEVITQAQLGVHAKPSGFLNTAGFYDALWTYFRQTVRDGFVSQDLLDWLYLESKPDKLVGQLVAHQPVSVQKKVF